MRKLFYAVRIAVLTRTWLVESLSTFLVFAKHHVETNCDHGTNTLLYFTLTIRDLGLDIEWELSVGLPLVRPVAFL